MADERSKELLRRLKEERGNSLDFSLVKEDQKLRTNTKIPIICCKCRRGVEGDWTTIVSSCLVGVRCLKCPGVQWRPDKISFDRLIEKITEKYGDTVDYSLITPEHISSAKSYVPLICRICGYGNRLEWTPQITNIGSKCPDCTHHVYWNASQSSLNRLLEKLTALYGTTLDFSKITIEHLGNGNKGKVPVTCRICDHGQRDDWLPRINNLLNGQKCPGCSKRVKWEPDQFSVDRLVKKLTEVHGSRYEYSLIKPEHIDRRIKSKIPIMCRNHRTPFIWYPAISNVCHNNSGCPRCNTSKGELAAEAILERIGAQGVIKQFILPTLARKKFDFMFEYRGISTLLEYDGEFHFRGDLYCDRDPNMFRRRQEYDIMKTRMAIISGYRLIRIDYTQINHIEKHILAAFEFFEKGHVTYYSRPEMYKYITDALPPKVKLNILSD